MNLLDLLRRNAQMYPDLAIWEDPSHGKYAFGHIEDSTSRIYSYLDEQGIGTEDVVAIRMRRSARIFLAMLGVWKAGAAFVVIGEHSPEDYVGKVLEDTGPKLVFDDASFGEALLRPRKEGYRHANLHDLACVVYSTGSSGTFKGSMHEYGAIQRRLERAYYYYSYSHSLVSPDGRESRVFSSGFYSIVAVTSLISSICYGEFRYVAGHEEIADTARLAAIMQEKKIDFATASPSVLEKLRTYDLPDLKEVELTYDVSQPTRDDRYIFSSSYGLTEGFGALTTITQGHEARSFVAGKPLRFKEMCIRDGRGGKVNPGELGEICFRPEYFRGYLNRPDLTKQAIRNGWFHTGDMGYVDGDGNYNVVGRKMDMLNTGQGYVVPALVSREISERLPGITRNYVKLFGDAGSYKVVVYYVSDAPYGVSDFTKALEGILPRRMLPTHAVKVDDLTCFPSGKINRLAFSEPR